MDLWIAAGWGVAGAAVAELASLSVDITTRGYRWPWADRPYSIYPRLVTILINVVIGALTAVVVATANVYQVRASLLAFTVGVVAPQAIRRTIITFEKFERRLSRETLKSREARIELEAARIGEIRAVGEDSRAVESGLSRTATQTLSARREDLLTQLPSVPDDAEEGMDAS